VCRLHCREADSGTSAEIHLHSSGANMTMRHAPRSDEEDRAFNDFSRFDSRVAQGILASHEGSSMVPSPGQIPLVLGVVAGARPVGVSEDAIKKAVKRLLGRIQTRYPKAPIQIVSRLAEDPEKWCAEEAIHQGFSVRPPVTGPAHATAGTFVAQHCLSLIAVWDGQQPNPAALSDTAQLIRFKLSGDLPQGSGSGMPPHVEGDTGPVLVINAPPDPRAPRKPGEVPIRVFVPRGRTDDEETIWGRLVRTVRSIGHWAAEIVGHGGETGAQDVFADWIESACHGVEVPRDEWDQPVTRWTWFGWRVFGALGLREPVGGRSEFWQFREVARNIDEFNRDVRRAPERLKGDIRNATPNLLAPREGPGREQWTSLGAREPLPSLACVYAAADGLASLLEGRLKWCHRGIFITIFGALVSFHIYSHFLFGEGHSPVGLRLFLLALMVSGMIVTGVWYTRLDSRRLDYRALAEALRVRYFWGLAGVQKSVADTYLGQLRGEMAWARRALKSLAPHPIQWRAIFEERSGPEQEECFRCVNERWVGHQAEYYRRRHGDFHRGAVRLRLIGFVLALAGWGYSGVLLLDLASIARASAEVPAAAPADAHHARKLATFNPRHPSELELILPSLLVIGGGLLIGYSERRAHEALARQYESMDVVFDRKRHELESVLATAPGTMTDDAKTSARTIIEQLGQEALVEHVHWLINHRVRPFELVIGG
jgi:hypothetical protein